MEFRDILESEYLERRRKNPRYSVRRFAQTLEMDSGTLSQILAGKRTLSLEKQAAALRKIGRTPIFPEVKGLNSEMLDLDQFQMMAEWYHFALIEVLQIPKASQSLEALSYRLGISQGDVARALARLERLGILKQKANGKYEVIKKNVSTLNVKKTHDALRYLQKQLIEQSLSALELVPVDERDHSGLTVAVPSRLVPEIKERLKRYRRELNQFIEQSKGHDEIYQLTMAFFPIAPEQYMKNKKNKNGDSK